jgi:hypothetical protein
MRKSQRALKVVTPSHEALYRGYCIEGAQNGDCMLLQVTPSRSDLPTLTYSRFRSLPRCTWLNAVNIVCGYIDQDLGDRTSRLRSLIEEQLESA